MPILILDSPGVPTPTQLASLTNWTFVPRKMHFFWQMGTAAPLSYDHVIEHAKFSDIALYSLHTDWLFEALVINTGTIPFCTAEGALSYSGGLGDPFVAAGNFYRKTLNIAFQNLNLLSPGLLLATMQCKVTAINPDSGLREVIGFDDLEIELKVASATTTEIALEYPGKYIAFGLLHTGLSMTYHQSGSVPTADIYFFTFPDTMIPPVISVTDPLLTYTHVPITPHFSKIVVSFDSDVSLLALDAHYFYNITIGGAIMKIRLNVFSTIIDLEPFLLVTPDSVSFDYSNGGSQNEDISPLYVNCYGAPWNLVSAIPDWLSVSLTSGLEGGVVFLTPINVSGFAPGEYSTILTFASGAFTKDVLITMNLTQFLTHPFVENKIFFSKELDFIQVSSANQNTYINFQLQIKVFKLNTYEPILYTREYDVALFLGKGEFHIGTIVDGLLEELDLLADVVPDTESNYWKNQYIPTEISGTYTEKQYPEAEGELIDFEASLPVITMIPGYKPFVSENQTALLTVMQQEISRITPQSVIGIGFCHFGNPRIIVKKNNVIIEDLILNSFPTEEGYQKLIYSYYRFANDFEPGNVIEIMVLGANEVRTQRYLVMPSEVESVHIFFKNHNGIVEPFEFTGRIKPNASYENVFGARFKDLFESKRKVASESSQSVILNTGKLLPADRLIIDAILKSENVWLSFGNAQGPYLRATCVTTKLPDDSFKTETEYDLEFNLLENADVVLYPR